MAPEVFELITSVTLGGAENVAFELARHCRVEGTPGRLAIVELFRSPGEYAQRKRQELNEAGVRVITLSPFGKRASLVIAPFALAWRVMRERPRLIHSHTDLPDLVLASCLRLMRLARLFKGADSARRPAPAILRTIHNVALWPTHAGLGRYTERAFQQDTIVAVSHAAMQAYLAMRQRHRLAAAARRSVIYNGCRAPQEQPLPFELPAGRLHIVFCGRFELQKGVDVLADRIRQIQARHPARFSFHLIGAGPLLPTLQALAQDTPDVQLHGPINGVAERLHAFDYLLMPSRFEGLPLVAIEASLAGLPVIAARAPGLTETLPEDWPLYFDLESAESLMTVLDRIAAGDLARDALGEVALAYASLNFSLEGMLKRYERALAECMTGNVAARH